MIILTHRLLGQFIYFYVQTHTGYEKLLDKNAFVYGNVRPDITNKYRAMSHYYCHNQSFVFTLFDELCTETYPKKEFSDKLGILIHFLTDYACVFHFSTNLTSKDIQNHMRYETMLHMRSVKRLKELTHIKPVLFNSRKEVEMFIKAYADEVDQSNEHLNVDRDIEQMVLSTVSITLYILEKQKNMRQLNSLSKS